MVQWVKQQNKIGMQVRIADTNNWVIYKERRCRRTWKCKWKFNACAILKTSISRPNDSPFAKSDPRPEKRPMVHLLLSAVCPHGPSSRPSSASFVCPSFPFHLSELLPMWLSTVEMRLSHGKCSFIVHSCIRLGHAFAIPLLSMQWALSSGNTVVRKTCAALAPGLPSLRRRDSKLLR